MELLKLLGIVIVIVGFALKLDSILVILAAAVVTAIVGGLGPVTLLETLGSTFVANRSMAILLLSCWSLALWSATACVRQLRL